MPIKAAISWLRDFVDIDIPIDELARRLTLAGIEVEHVTTIGAEWENIYTGEVVQLERHPNADRLNLATVRYGEGKDITVVTGAPNIEQGQKVVLGLLGCRYLDQHQDPPRWATLKAAKIRGVQTEGMVMSEAELALSQEHEGIIVLDSSTPVGQTAREVLGDTILEIDVTPNMGRILSMVGLAREIAALLDKEVRLPSTEWQDSGPPTESLLSVEIQDPDLCLRYTGGVIQNVQIGPSPAWMQRRIALAGMRPINNIVDITNYVMLEMGQPLHAFDYDAVVGHKIVVRRARPGEHIETLDHVDRTLDDKMLAICDVEKPVALAGVMGGANSEIGTEGTATVLLESAHFNPLSIRRTARLLKLPSEASYRFERWVDPTLTVPAMKRAAELMRQLSGGTICRGYVDEYPDPLKPVRIHFYTSEVERLLGVQLPPSQIAAMLERLGFRVDIPQNADIVSHRYATLLIDVPSYRHDVTLAADVVEEVARMVGYDIIPETLLQGGLPPQEVNRSYDAAERIRDLMVDAGMDEMLTYSVSYSEDISKLIQVERSIVATSHGAEGDRPTYSLWDTSRPPVTIVNPVSSRQDVMRPTLLANMLNTLRMNMRYLPETPARIFELGKVYTTRIPEEVEQRKQELQRERERYPRLQQWPLTSGEEYLPLEPRRLMGAMSGPRNARSLFADYASSKGQTTAAWRGDERLDFFDAKAVVTSMLEHLHIDGVEWLRVDAPLFHPGRSALLRVGGTELGIVGELHPQLVAEWDIPGSRVAAWDLDVEALIAATPDRVIYSQVSPYLPVRQDMAFVVPIDMPAGRVAETIQRAGGNSVTEVSLFDIYAGQQLQPGAKSLAFSVLFSSVDKPLTEEDIARLRRRIESMLNRELGAKLRT